MKQVIFSGVALLFLINILSSQAVWTIQDPLGNDIILHKDSSYLTQSGEYLIMYALDKSNDNRNILVTKGDTSFWLLDNGIEKADSYSPFLKRKQNELVFRGGETWYISGQTPETTEVFHDNQDINNSYEYLRIFEAGSINFNINNLIIEAKEKNTGDTVILYHTTVDNLTSLFGNKLRIQKGGLPALGFNGQLMIVSVFNESTQSWGEVGLYREFLKVLTLIFPLGVKQNYELTYLSFFGNKLLVDHLDNGTKLAYRYYSSTDTCLNITSTLFPGYSLLDFQNVKWTAHGLPLEPPLSYNEYFWKGRDQNNVVRYFVPGSLEDQEVTDLQNVANVDFLYSGYTSDSIYYYNYSNMQRGLMRAQIYNGGTKKDLTSIPFNSDFKLKGYLGKMYFGRYNPQSGKIEAMVKDLEPNTYSFLESTNGKRIETPIDFTFLDDKVFAHSRTVDGIKLVVYDPDGIVAVKPQIVYNDNILVTPNPSSSIFNLVLPDELLSLTNLSYTVVNSHGVSMFQHEVSESSLSIDLSDYPVGAYFITVFTENRRIATKSLILTKK